VNQIILNRFTAGFKALLRKSLKLLVQLLTLAQISDESDSLQPQNEKQLRTTQLGESTHTAISLRMISRFGGPSGRPGNRFVTLGTGLGGRDYLPVVGAFAGDRTQSKSISITTESEESNPMKVVISETN